MNVLSINKIATLFAACLLAVTIPSFAQQGGPPSNQQSNPGLQQGTGSQEKSEEVPYSDQELQKFVRVMKASQSIKKESRQKMQQKVKESSLDVQTYQKINAQKQRQGSFPEDISEEDKKAFNKLNKEMKKIEKNFKKEMDAAIRKEGMKKKKFQEMSRAAQKNKAMQKKMQEMM